METSIWSSDWTSTELELGRVENLLIEVEFVVLLRNTQYCLLVCIKHMSSLNQEKINVCPLTLNFKKTEIKEQKVVKNISFAH